MKYDSEIRLNGVGAFIVNPDIPHSFLTIRELTTWRGTRKVSGMKSMPMETIEEGETHQQALGRLFTEEVILDDIVLGSSLPAKLHEAEISEGVILHTFVFTSRDEKPKVGTAKKEVQSPVWTPFSNVLDTDSSRQPFRAGNFEAINDYLSWIKGESEYQVRQHPFQSLRHKLVADFFDQISEDSNLPELWCKWVSAA